MNFPNLWGVQYLSNSGKWRWNLKVGFRDIDIPVFLTRREARDEKRELDAMVVGVKHRVAKIEDGEWGVLDQFSGV